MRIPRNPPASAVGRSQLAEGGRNDFHIGHYLRDLITKIYRVTIGDLLFCLGGVLLNLLQLGCKICGDHTFLLQ